VKERIDALFGSDYGFKLSNSEMGGTQALISLPIIREKPGTQGGDI
jgi:hypothetical protein